MDTFGRLPNDVLNHISGFLIQSTSFKLRVFIKIKMDRYNTTYEDFVIIVKYNEDIFTPIINEIKNITRDEFQDVQDYYKNVNKENITILNLWIVS